MFKKLLKYDIKAVSKFWWIGAVISFAAAIVSAALIRFYIYVINNEAENLVFSFVSIFGVIFAVFCIIAVILSFVFTVVLVFVRFYKHLFTDEGYLTFTLPVKRSTLFLSKTVNAVIWFSAHLGVIVISLLLFALLVCPLDEGDFLINFVVFEKIGEFFSTIWSHIGAWLIVYILEVLLIIFVYQLFTILLVHFCITFGSTLVKKAKLILSIGLYYAFSSVLGAVGQFSIYFFGIFISDGVIFLMENATKNQTCATIAFLILTIVGIVSAVSAVLYSITQYMLDRKLNLA